MKTTNTKRMNIRCDTLLAGYSARGMTYSAAGTAAQRRAKRLPFLPAPCIFSPLLAKQRSYFTSSHLLRCYAYRTRWARGDAYFSSASASCTRRTRHRAKQQDLIDDRRSSTSINASGLAAALAATRASYPPHSCCYIPAALSDTAAAPAYALFFMASPLVAFAAGGRDVVTVSSPS